MLNKRILNFHRRQIGKCDLYAYCIINKITPRRKFYSILKDSIDVSFKTVNRNLELLTSNVQAIKKFYYVVRHVENSYHDSLTEIMFRNREYIFNDENDIVVAANVDNGGRCFVDENTH